MRAGGKNLFQIQGNSHQLINWEEYGLRITVPQDTLSSSNEICDINVKVLVSGLYILPEGTELVSAVYYVFASKPLLQPVTLEIQHCAHLITQDHTTYLSFVTADLYQPDSRYCFQLKEGGQFNVGNDYGSISFSYFSLYGIIKSITHPIWWLLGSSEEQTESFVELIKGSSHIYIRVTSNDKSAFVPIAQEPSETHSIIKESLQLVQGKMLYYAIEKCLLSL